MVSTGFTRQLKGFMALKTNKKPWNRGIYGLKFSAPQISHQVSFRLSPATHVNIYEQISTKAVPTTDSGSEIKCWLPLFSGVSTASHLKSSLKANILDACFSQLAARNFSKN